MNLIIFRCFHRSLNQTHERSEILFSFSELESLQISAASLRSLRKTHFRIDLGSRQNNFLCYRYRVWSFSCCARFDLNGFVFPHVTWRADMILWGWRGFLKPLLLRSFKSPLRVFVEIYSNYFDIFFFVWGNSQKVYFGKGSKFIFSLVRATDTNTSLRRCLEVSLRPLIKYRVQFCHWIFFHSAKVSNKPEWRNHRAPPIDFESVFIPTGNAPKKLRLINIHE